MGDCLVMAVPQDLEQQYLPHSRYSINIPLTEGRERWESGMALPGAEKGRLHTVGGLCGQDVLSARASLNCPVGTEQQL